jgi:hypothetical protein
MKVESMRSTRGNAIPNQFIIHADDGVTYFQSYNTVIARIENNKTALDVNKWNCSKTTATHRNQFLGMTTAEIKAGINAGTIELVDLN